MNPSLFLSSLKLTGSAAPTSRKHFTAFYWLAVFPSLSCHKVHLLAASLLPLMCVFTLAVTAAVRHTRGCGIKPYSLFRSICANIQQHKGGFKMEEKLSAFPVWGLRAQSGEEEGKKTGTRGWPENVTSLNMFLSNMLHEASPGLPSFPLFCPVQGKRGEGKKVGKQLRPRC